MILGAENLRIIAIIPARSGSKGLKDKNIKLLNNKPLMAYTIEAAVGSGIFSEIFVSTDSEEYAQIAQRFGAKVPFLRKAELSSDTASSWDVVCDVLQQYSATGLTFDCFALLQPTSPLRKAQDIINAFDMMQKKRANAIVSVTEADHSPLWFGTLPKDRSLVNFFRHNQANQPRQQLETYYRINGAIYLVKIDYFSEVADIYQNKCYAYIMDKESSVDIDTAFDFAMAETIISLFSKK